MKKLFLAFILALLASTEAHATVTTTSSYTEFDCSGASTYAIAWPFLEKAHIVVTYWADGGEDSPTTFTQDGGTSPSYTVTMYNGGATGLVTLTNGTTCASGYNLKIQRTVPVTQTIAFRSQGSFNPRYHEYMGDKLTMIIQQLDDDITQSEDTATAIANHLGAADDHSNYFYLPGRSGGQTGYGGSADTEYLALYSSAAGTVTSGGIDLYGGADAYVWIGNEPTWHSNNSELYVDADLWVNTGNHATVPTLYSPLIYGSESQGATLVLETSSDATPTSSSKMYLGRGSGDSTILMVDEYNERVGIGTASPVEELHVLGEAVIQTGGLCVNCTSRSATYELYVSGDMMATANAQINGDTYQVGTLFGHTTISTEDLHLSSTAHATKGSIYFGEEGGDIYAGVDEAAGAYFGNRPFMTKSANYTVSGPEDCNSTILVDTDAVVISLPDLSTELAGCTVTVINIGADAAVEIAVDPDATDYIFGSCIGDDAENIGGATVVQLDNSAGEGLATNNGEGVKGDSVTLIGDGDTTWWIQTCTGEWEKY